MPKKNKVGRPNLPKNKVYSPGISLRLVQDERKTIDKAIAASGLSQSDWARKALLYVASNGINLS
jgi:uncharacterized protein (DUF1778 family)